MTRRAELLLSGLRRDVLNSLEHKTISKRSLAVMLLDTLEVLRLLTEAEDANPFSGSGLTMAKVSGDELRKMLGEEGDTDVKDVKKEAPRGAYL